MVPVIDLFAGPGGLCEGFSSFLDENGKPVFQSIMSVEKDSEAHKTLRLRAYLRKILRPDGTVPRVYAQYMRYHTPDHLEKLIAYAPEKWAAAEREALCATLVDGDMTLVEEARKRLSQLGVHDGQQWVLIGGPPCQAYSIVGRSRRAHDATLEDDVKQTLYKCYLAFITELKPTVFVMENVKGLLSARRKGEGVFGRICADMRAAGYEVRSLVSLNPTNPRDYIVRAEEYGIPQKRHRVILLGVRAESEIESDILEKVSPVTLKEALAGIPKIRSGFSDRSSAAPEENWASYIDGAATRLLKTEEGKALSSPLERVIGCRPPRLTKKDTVSNAKGVYQDWYRARLSSYRVLANHEARSHMPTDLERYLFCAAFAEVNGKAARIADFPSSLYPNHRNVKGLGAGDYIKFDDRFRVQLYDEPSTTITAHIAKDGHYYIHPDPVQCRSLTVREAARLQTFPDDYLFEGNRTSQYTQVGNAVPPLLAQKIAGIVATYLESESGQEL